MSKENKCFCLTQDSESFTDSKHGAYKFECGEKPKISWKIRRCFHTLEVYLYSQYDNYLCTDDPDFMIGETLFMLEELIYELCLGHGRTTLMGDWSILPPDYDIFTQIYPTGTQDHTYYGTLLAYKTTYNFDFILAESEDNCGLKMRVYTEDINDIQYGYLPYANDYSSMVGTWQKAIDLGSDRPDPFFILDFNVEDGQIIWDEILQLSNKNRYLYHQFYTNWEKVHYYSNEYDDPEEAYNNRFQNGPVTSTSEGETTGSTSAEYYADNKRYYLHLTQNIGDFDPESERYNPFRDIYLNPYYENFMASVTIYKYALRYRSFYYPDTYQYIQDSVGDGIKESQTAHWPNFDPRMAINGTDVSPYPGPDGAGKDYESHVLIDLREHPSIIHTNFDDVGAIHKDCFRCMNSQLDVNEIRSKFKENYIYMEIPYGMPGGPQYWKDKEWLTEDNFFQIPLHFNPYNPENIPEEELPIFRPRRITMHVERDTEFETGGADLMLNGYEDHYIINHELEMTPDTYWYANDYVTLSYMNLTYDLDEETDYHRPQRYHFLAKFFTSMPYTQLTHEGSSQRKWKVKLKNKFDYDFVVDSNINFGAIHIYGVYHDDGEELDVTYTEWTPANQTEYAPVSTTVNFALQTTASGTYSSTYRIYFHYGNTQDESTHEFQIKFTFKIS